MSEQEEPREERTLIININLTRGAIPLLVLLLAAVVIGTLAWGGPAAADVGEQAATAASTGMRQYYMSKSWHNGANATTLCAAGYHMASLWEIIDVSNLKYNTELGYVQDDSGSGPPTAYTPPDGWVRTGYSANVTNTQGQGNCDAWSTADGDKNGTLAWLANEWDPSTAEIHTWVAGWQPCSSMGRAWCVED